MKLTFAIFMMLLIFGFSASMSEARSIVVGGVAEKSIEPNIIFVSFEIWAKAATAKQAQQISATQFQKVKKSFENFKVQKQDISTENYSLNPEYAYDQKAQQNKMTGFRVGQAMTVTLRKTDDIGGFLDALGTSSKSSEFGVSVNSIRWDSDKRAQLELVGLGDAVLDTKKKADEIAKAAGVRIKSITQISHNVNSGNSPHPVFSGALAKSMSAPENVPTELSAGQVKVHVEVQAEYEIN